MSGTSDSERLMAEVDAGRLEHLPALVRQLRRRNDTGALAALEARFLEPIREAVRAFTARLAPESEWRQRELRDALDTLDAVLDAGFRSEELFAVRLLGQGGHAVVVETVRSGAPQRVAWKLPFGVASLLRDSHIAPVPLQMIGGITLTPSIGALRFDQASGVLERTAEWLEALPHPHPLAALYETCVVSAQTTLVMEHLTGPSLRASLPLDDAGALRRSVLLEEAGESEVWARLAALARSVLELHVLGVHHGDLKPEHIFFTEDGVRLIDPLPERAAPDYQGDPWTLWLGSPGYTFALSTEAPPMRDLIALSAIALELFGVEPGWRTVFFDDAAAPSSPLAWLRNTEPRYHTITAPLQRASLSPGLTDWIHDVLHAAHILPYFPRDLQRPDADWRRAMLERLALLCEAEGRLSDIPAEQRASLPTWPAPDEANAVRLPEARQEAHGAPEVAEAESTPRQRASFWERLRGAFRRRR